MWPGRTPTTSAIGQTTTSRTNKWSTRVDHHFSGGSTLFGRFNWQETPSIRHTGVIGAPGMLEGVYQQFVEPAGGYNMAGGWVKPFGAKVVSELNVVGWKSRWIISRSIDQENWEEKLGFDTASALPDHQSRRQPRTRGDAARQPGGLHAVGTRGGRVAARATGASRRSTRLPGRRGTTTSSSGSDRSGTVTWATSTSRRGSGPTEFDGYATGQVIRNAAGAITGATLGDPFADFLLGAPSSFAGNISGRLSATAIPGARGASTSPTTPPSSRTSGRCRATSA